MQYLLYLRKRVQDAALKAREERQEAKRKLEENDEEEKTKRLYYKTRKFLQIKDGLCMLYAITCILGPL